MTPKELKHKAPILANIQKHGSGYKLPKDYFNGIEKDVFNQLLVKHLPNKVGYQVPTDYFKQVENDIISELQIQTNSILEEDIPKDYFGNFEDNLFKRLKTEKVTKTVFFKKYWIPLAIAASLLLFISVYNPFKKEESLNIAEIEAWIEEGNLELNSYEIADLYDFEMDDVSVNQNLNTNNIEDYLLEEIDESIFYN